MGAAANVAPAKRINSAILFDGVFDHCVVKQIRRIAAIVFMERGKKKYFRRSPDGPKATPPQLPFPDKKQ